MKFHELNVKKAKSGRRVGRGIASGRGKTAGRGTKGQGARTGFSKKPGFEGGQNPLMQRLPKLRGFNSHRVKPETVKLSELESLTSKTVDAKVLAEKGLITSAYSNVKVVASGELKKALTVNLPAASSGAIEAIERAGGTFTTAARLARPKTTTKEQPAASTKTAKN